MEKPSLIKLKLAICRGSKQRSLRRTSIGKGSTFDALEEKIRTILQISNGSFSICHEGSNGMKAIESERDWSGIVSKHTTKRAIKLFVTPYPEYDQKSIASSVPSLRPSSKEAAAATQSILWRGKFIGDVSIEDNSILSGGCKYEKIWLVKNNGSRTWPRDSKLVVSKSTVDQTKSFACPQEVQIGSPLSPGTVATVSVTFIAPKNPGRYSAKYVLVSPNGAISFKTELWLMFVIQGECDEPRSNPPLVVEQPLSTDNKGTQVASQGTPSTPIRVQPLPELPAASESIQSDTMGTAVEHPRNKEKNQINEIPKPSCKHTPTSSHGNIDVDSELANIEMTLEKRQSHIEDRFRTASRAFTNLKVEDAVLKEAYVDIMASLKILLGASARMKSVGRLVHQSIGALRELRRDQCLSPRAASLLPHPSDSKVNNFGQDGVKMSQSVQLHRRSTQCSKYPRKKSSSITASQSNELDVNPVAGGQTLVIHLRPDQSLKITDDSSINRSQRKRASDCTSQRPERKDKTNLIPAKINTIKNALGDIADTETGESKQALVEGSKPRLDLNGFKVVGEVRRKKVLRVVNQLRLKAPAAAIRSHSRRL